MSEKKNGFTLGVILGAVIGTGALIMTKSKEGKVIRKKVLQKLDELKEAYPEQAEKLENVVTQALQEAKTLTEEIRQNPTKKKSTSKPKPKKRLFVKNSS